jgi:hypothetical protein
VLRACLSEDDAPMPKAMAANRYAMGDAFIDRTEDKSSGS